VSNTSPTNSKKATLFTGTSTRSSTLRYRPSHNLLIPHSYVRLYTCATLTVQRALFKISVVQIEIELKLNEFADYNTVELEGWGLCFRVNSLHAERFHRSQPLRYREFQVW
jgi:hypothetical protein